MTTTTTGFDEHALARLPSPAPFLDAIRTKAFEAFEALPIPSQETEEWRYTDLEGFGFDLRPFVEGGRAENLDQVPEEILAAAGQVGERAGLQIQRNSEVMVTHLDPALAGKGVWFGDLDRAIAERPDLVEPYLHALVPADRSKFTALHAAFRSAGTFLYVPPGVEIELPLQTMTWIDAEDAAVFPRTLLVVGENAEVTLIDRYGSPALGRALSDAIVEIHAGPGSRVRYVGLQEYGDGVTHLAVQRARIGRGADLKSLGVAFGASLARVEVEALAGRGRRQLGDARRVLRRRRAAHRPSLDPGSRRLAHLERPPLQGRDARLVQRDLHRDRDHRARRAPVRRLPDQPEHPAVRPRPGAVGAEPGDPDQRPHAVRPRRERRARSPTTSSST